MNVGIAREICLFGFDSVLAVIKVEQLFYRLPFEKTSKFENYRNYVISFCLVQQKNTNWNLTQEQLQKVAKEQPKVSCECL